MSEEVGTAPAGDGSAATASEVPAAAVGSEASAGSGNAPGASVDVAAVEGTPGKPAGLTAAEFQILNRKFRDQKHAEEVLGGELGRVRSTQRENAELKNQLQRMNAELGALRQMVSAPGLGSGQGVSKGAQGLGGPKSFARELAENGELEVIAKIFADPEMGPAHAMYRMAELLDERGGKQLEQVKEEIRADLTQRDTRTQQERAVAKAFGAARALAESYPELDDANQSDEAIAAQQEILRIIEDTFPPETLAKNPERVLRMAVEEYRRSYGTPVFAQPPGTSGSPSVRALQAAEASAAQAAGTPLEGTGMPRARQGGPESPIERIKRENRELSKKVATTPSGRPLGFSA